MESLRRAVCAGARAKFVFFWGHAPPSDASVSSSCFSQWYAAPFRVGEARYPTAEHFMMAEKARLFADGDAERRILEAGSPGAAKAIGREVRGFVEDVWVQHRFGIAVRGNREKFSQNPRLAGFLEGTARRVLVEASPVDRIWGIGLEAHHPHATNPQLWCGLNLLGFALMEVRDRLAAG